MTGDAWESVGILTLLLFRLLRMVPAMTMTTNDFPRCGATRADPAGAGAREQPASAEGGVADPLVIYRGQVCQRTLREQRLCRRETSRAWLIANALVEAGLKGTDFTQDAKSPDWVRPPRPARCGRRATGAAPSVAMSTGEFGNFAYLIGTETCGSIWACPPCSAKLRGQRAAELRTAFQTVLENSSLNPGLFLTLTLRHTKDMPLKSLMTTLQRAYETMRTSRAWRNLMDRLGHVGIIRATEITYSFRNGWHPHFHCWLVTNHRVPNLTVEAAESEIATLWRVAVTKLSPAMVPSAKRGCDLRRVTTQGFAAYIAKNQDDTGLGSQRSLANELVRFDLKQGRRKSSITPFELLDKGSNYADLWVEYFNATKGHKASAWSRGLKEKLGLVGKPGNALDNSNPPGKRNSQVQFSIAPSIFDKLKADDLARVLADTEANPEQAAFDHGTPLAQLTTGRAVLRDPHAET
ncbi:MAG: protein rep [Promicromonosporaceae bacterium]|nr:protein rep [Promicromonosporaceae bacterium]